MTFRPAMALMLAASFAWPAAAQPAQCDIRVMNADPEGTATNVRAGPSTTSKVLFTLENEALVELHIVGRSGDWFRIDRVDDAEQDKRLFRGSAWIHRSQAGLSVAGGDHRLYATPSRQSKALMKLTPDGNALEILDCRGGWVKVVVDDKTPGWMAPDAQCSNPMTTCS